MAKSFALLVLLSCTALAGCGTGAGGDRPGATGDAAVQRLVAEKVPAELRSLIPLAERWGVGDDAERAAAIARSTPAEREELREAIEPVHATITAWLDSFGQRAMSDEAAAFMYMQLALEEIRAGGAG